MQRLSIDSFVDSTAILYFANCSVLISSKFCKYLDESYLSVFSSLNILNVFWWRWWKFYFEQNFSEFHSLTTLCCRLWCQSQDYVTVNYFLTFSIMNVITRRRSSTPNFCPTSSWAVFSDESRPSS